MKYKAVIFDFNGVILFDTPWHDRAWNATAKKLRGKEFSTEEMETEVHGHTNKDIFSYLLSRLVTGKDLADLTNIKEKMYQEIALKQKDFRLSPGAEDFFDLLLQNKIPFTIATSSEINNMKFFFEHLHLDKWFSLDSITYDDGIMPSKPEPDIFFSIPRSSAAGLRMEN